MAKSAGGSTIQTHLIVGARVLRCAPAGLIIDLGQGREGLVREREIAWDAEARRGWRQHYQPGQSVQVVPLKETHGARPEFSLRLAHHDPWLDAGAKYLCGAVVEGVVTSVMPYGAFIELEPGIIGLLHVERFPTMETREPAAIFWPGDYVKVLIDQVDIQLRRIELSMRTLSQRRWTWLETAGAQHTAPLQSLPQHNATSELLPLVARPSLGSKLILVVDDDAQMREKLFGWLRNAGHIVVLAHDSATALAAADGNAPEIALVDIDLGSQSGVDVMRRLHIALPQLQGILMTGHYDTQENDLDLLTLLEEGVALLWKPFQSDELLSCIAEGQAHTGPSRSPKPKAAGSPVVSGPKHLADDLEHAWLAQVLVRLRSTVHAHSVALFCLDPASRQVRLVEQAGHWPARSAILPTLLHSPVRDAAEDGLVVRAINAHEAAGPRFRHLSDLVPFESCLGLPVPAELPERYALFAFYNQPALADAGEIVEAHMAATAAMLAARWERRHFLTQMAALQGVLLLGQLSRSLIHEINNQRQNLPGAAAMLAAHLQKIAQSANTGAATLTWEIVQAQALQAKLSHELDHLANVTDPLLLMARQAQREFLLLDEMVQAAIDVVRDLANRSHVVLVVQRLTPFCYTRAAAASVIQVLVNVLLNAIQQIARAHGRAGGRVVIELAPAEVSGRTMYCIRIEDDGPGIHWRLWERIFEMGYTEREEGSGLGLFISRNLVTTMGGRLFVAASAILWGSTFVIELPQQT